VTDSQKRDQTPAKVFEGEWVKGLPTPRVRSRLTNIREVRREMAKVYIEARAGTLRTDVATRLVYILTQISNLIRDSELEDRVKQLEDELSQR
jgi:DNA-binding TFAR19-related protein (PDSD5 family)